MKKSFIFSLIALILSIPFMLFGVDAVAVAVAAAPALPDMSNNLTAIIAAIAELITNWKVLGSWGVAAVLINIIIAILKSDFTDSLFKWSTKAPLIKRLIIVVLGQGMGVAAGLTNGMTIWASMVAGLITSMGAIAIYEAAKPLLPWTKS